MGRNNILNATKITSGQSLAADFESEPVMVETSNNLGVWIDASAVTDNTGTFSVQVRPYKDANNVGPWVSLATTYSIANADIAFFRKETSLPVCQMRVSFVAAGGTPDGVVDVWVSASGS